jgi:hypothetical protein
MTTRRNFLGGLALLAVAPATVREIGLEPGGSKEIEVAQLADMRREIDKIGPLGTSGIRAALASRINAHYALFGELPKALFVSHGEANAYERELTPVMRYTLTDVSRAGYDNLLFRGIPVMSVDNQLMIPEGQLR